MPDLPPEHFLRGANVADAREQLFEVVASACALEPLVVQGETLDDVLSQSLGRPDAKLYAAVRLHPVPNGNDHVEVEVLSPAEHFPRSFNPNGRRFCNGCLSIELALLKHVLDVPRNDGLIPLKELADSGEREPAFPHRSAPRDATKPRRSSWGNGYEALASWFRHALSAPASNIGIDDVLGEMELRLVENSPIAWAASSELHARYEYCAECSGPHRMT